MALCRKKNSYTGAHGVEGKQSWVVRAAVQAAKTRKIQSMVAAVGGKKRRAKAFGNRPEMKGEKAVSPEVLPTLLPADSNEGEGRNEGNK